MLSKYTDIALRETEQLLAIDSPTGCTAEAEAHLLARFEALGFSARRLCKGGVLADLGGEGEGILLMAHTDTLGAMVAEVKPNGRLRISPLNGLEANNAETENVRIHTRSGKVYEGTLQLCNASVHVNDNYKKCERTFDTLEVVVDMPTASAAETAALGIRTGDFICPEPRTRITESGYIKSRFLDDKLSVGILLSLADRLREARPNRHVYMLITAFEEVGHGASFTVPADVRELLCVDMGCVGDGLACTEHTVSICPKDSHGPYSKEVVDGLVRAAEASGAAYALDIYPHYGSDAGACVAAGNDVRFGLIGPGVYASHGYERSHSDGVLNTLKLLFTYLGL
ncbi:MAG: M42 family metallopeptidase [Clostridia bacterium]|nr:M42 family metallopeptidase [Clostridia bacterium]